MMETNQTNKQKKALTFLKPQKTFFSTHRTIQVCGFALPSLMVYQGSVTQAVGLTLLSGACVSDSVYKEGYPRREDPL